MIPSTFPAPSLPSKRCALPLALVLLLLAGCGGSSGGGGDDGTPSPTATPTPLPTATPLPTGNLSVEPSTATLLPGATQTFSATVAGGGSGVVWSTLEGQDAGTITSDGVYTASALRGTYHVVATRRDNSNIRALATVTVATQVTVTPTSATLSVGDSVALRAQALGFANSNVTWSVRESSGGTVSPAGIYQAPTTVGTYHVVAASQEDPTQTAIATLTVQSGNLTGIIQ